MAVVDTGDEVSFTARCDCGCGQDTTWLARRQVEIVTGYSYCRVAYTVPCPGEQLREVA